MYAIVAAAPRRSLQLGGVNPECKRVVSRPQSINLVNLASKVLAVVLTLLYRGALWGAILFAGIYNHCGQRIAEESRRKLVPCFVDAQGRYADFHALRKTFITNLSKSGVSPKMAQSLARHSDINLTMNVYTDVVLEDQAVAVELLPELPTLAAISRTYQGPKHPSASCQDA